MTGSDRYFEGMPTGAEESTRMEDEVTADDSRVTRTSGWGK